MSPTRDRLNELQQLSSVVVENGKNGKTNVNNIRDIHEKSDVIRQWIEGIKENTRKADEILKNNTFHLSEDLQNDLETSFKNTTSIAFKINNKLKEIEQELKKSDNVATAEYRIKKLQLLTLQRTFQEALRESNDVLEKHRNSRREILRKAFKTVGKNVQDDEELEALMEDKKFIQTFTDNYLQETEEVKRQVADIEERHRELLKIEEQLTEVRDLFTQIAIMVQEQQESIDRAEYHASTAVEYVEDGTVDLGKTERSKRKYNKRKTYVIIALCIIILVILVMLFL